MILCCELKNGLCKMVTKSQIATKFNVTKWGLHCTKKTMPLKIWYEGLGKTHLDDWKLVLDSSEAKCF